jgi:hypothetical protein
MQRTIGRLLISLAARASAVIPIRSDGIELHIFSPQCSPHARFHGVVSKGMLVLLAPGSLWLLWRRSADKTGRARCA